MSATVEDLTDGQLAELKAALQAAHAELKRVLGLSEAGAKTVDLDEPIGRLSRMDAMQQQQMVAEQRRRQSVRLEQVRAALQAFDEDEYGFCNACDDPIGYKRLKARPETPLCVRCQSERERG